MFFPILWIIVLSFKTETDAIRAPLEVLTSGWTLDSYETVQGRSDYFKHFMNSVIMLSTKMLPSVGVLIPIYLIFRDWSLLDTRFGLVMVLMLINLPIIIWMLYTYFKEIPGEILEAARMDGASLGKEVLYVLTPMALPGIASTMLLNVILAWNEAFWTLNLTAANAAPLTAFIASYSSPEGLFYAKLSAASVMAIAPILIIGWFSQKQLVRGLTFGAVK